MKTDVPRLRTDKAVDVVLELVPDAKWVIVSIPYGSQEVTVYINRKNYYIGFRSYDTLIKPALIDRFDSHSDVNGPHATIRTYDLR